MHAFMLSGNLNQLHLRLKACVLNCLRVRVCVCVTIGGSDGGGGAPPRRWVRSKPRRPVRSVTSDHVCETRSRGHGQDDWQTCRSGSGVDGQWTTYSAHSSRSDEPQRHRTRPNHCRYIASQISHVLDCWLCGHPTGLPPSLVPRTGS